MMLYIGVYVPADPQFPKHFHGLGMRIEDEVLVGAEHPVVLSASAPKEVCLPNPSPFRSISTFFTMAFADRGRGGRVSGSTGIWAILTTSLAVPPNFKTYIQT
jgi:hypothetical protein